MHKSLSNLNTVLASTKCILIVAAFILVVLSIARLLELSATGTGALLLTMFPFFVIAGFWMYLTKNVFVKRTKARHSVEFDVS